MSSCSGPNGEAKPPSAEAKEQVDPIVLAFREHPSLEEDMTEAERWQDSIHEARLRLQDRDEEKERQIQASPIIMSLGDYIRSMLTPEAEVPCTCIEDLKRDCASRGTTPVFTECPHSTKGFKSIGGQGLGLKQSLTLAKDNAHHFSDAPQGFGAIPKLVDQITWELYSGANDAQDP